jgi:hypothetical protein
MAWTPIYLDAVGPDVLKICNGYMNRYLKLQDNFDKLTTPKERLQYAKEAVKKSFLFHINLTQGDLIEKLHLEMIEQNPVTKEIYLGFHGLLATLFHYTVEYKKYVALMASRGYCKTFFEGHCGPQWVALNPSVLGGDEWSYFTASGGVVEKVNDLFATDLETNANIITIYGEQKKKGNTWNQDRLQLANGFKINFAGAGYQTRGPHPKGATFDDFESSETAASDKMTDSLDTWFRKDLAGQLAPSAPRIYSGTNIGPSTVLARIFHDPLTGKPRPHWDTFKFRACDKIPIGNGEFKFKNAIWRKNPDFNAAGLKKIWETNGDWAFDSEYQNEPHGSNEPIFNRTWIEKNSIPLDWFPPVGACDLLMAYDPAVLTEDVHDFTAWAEALVSKRAEDYGTVYIRMVNQAKMTTNEKAIHMIMQHVKYHPFAIGLEEETAQRYLGDHIRHVSMSMNAAPNIIPLHTKGKDKGARALSIQGLVQGGRVKFALGLYPAFIHQLINFTPQRGHNNSHDDMVDAFVWVLKLVQQWYFPKREQPAEDVIPEELPKLQKYRMAHSEQPKEQPVKWSSGRLHPITGVPL